jgi:hypothetical protein
MKSILKVATGLLAMTAVPAQAGLICEVNTAGPIGVGGDSILYVQIIGAGILGICSMNGTSAGGTTKEACAAWYGAMLSYRAMRARAHFYFDTANPVNAGVNSCAELGDWRARTPYFMETIQ